MPDTIIQSESGLKTVREALSPVPPAGLRLLHFSRSTLWTVASATLLLAAQAAPIHAAPDPDAVTIAQAYGELSVFILNVADGNDGRPRHPALDDTSMRDPRGDALDDWLLSTIASSASLSSTHSPSRCFQSTQT